eukprot:g7771.t1
MVFSESWTKKRNFKVRWFAIEPITAGELSSLVARRVLWQWRAVGPSPAAGPSWHSLLKGKCSTAHHPRDTGLLHAAQVVTAQAEITVVPEYSFYTPSRSCSRLAAKLLQGLPPVSHAKAAVGVGLPRQGPRQCVEEARQTRGQPIQRAARCSCCYLSVAADAESAAVAAAALASAAPPP